MRPSKLDQARAAAIVASVKGGAGRRDAARASGVATSTVQEWIRKGREGHADYAAFAEAIDIADSSAVVVAESKLYTLGVQEGDVRALMTWLRAKRPKKYGERFKVDATGRSSVSVEELAALTAAAQELRKS